MTEIWARLKLICTKTELSLHTGKMEKVCELIKHCICRNHTELPDVLHSFQCSCPAAPAVAQYSVHGGNERKQTALAFEVMVQTLHPLRFAQALCFACSTMTRDKSRLLVGSISSSSQAEVAAVSLPPPWAQPAALLTAIALQPQSKKAAGAAWHFYRSPRISTSAGSVSTDRMVYYSWGCSPHCLSCSIKLSCKGRYLPCSHLSRGHFAPVFSDVTDKHSCLKCFRFTAPRYSRYNSYTPINCKCLSITRREMFMLHYARLRAQLLWITRRLLLWAYCNRMWHSLSYFLLPSQEGLCRRNAFTLCHCRNSHYLHQLQPAGWVCPYICQMYTINSPQRRHTESEEGSQWPSRSHYSKHT